LADNRHTPHHQKKGKVPGAMSDNGHCEDLDDGDCRSPPATSRNEMFACNYRLWKINCIAIRCVTVVDYLDEGSCRWRRCGDGMPARLLPIVFCFDFDLHPIICSRDRSLALLSPFIWLRRALLCSIPLFNVSILQLFHGVHHAMVVTLVMVVLLVHCSGVWCGVSFLLQLASLLLFLNRSSDSWFLKMKRRHHRELFFFNWPIIPVTLDDSVSHFLFSSFQQVDLRVTFLGFWVRDVTLSIVLTCDTIEKKNIRGCGQTNKTVLS